MKNILYGLTLFLALFFNSCEGDTTQDHSLITNYVVFELKGGDFINVPVGTSYEEPGVIATEGGEDVTSQVVISGAVDINKMGIYMVKYSAVNKDGFASSVYRTVAVYDPTIVVSIPSGTYTVAQGTHRLNPKTGAIVPYDGYKVNIKEAALGIYQVSDYLGGYYDKRAGYGPAYAMKGYMKLNNNYTLEILSGDVAGWSDSYEDFKDASYDPTTGVLKWSVAYAVNFVFNVILTK